MMRTASVDTETTGVDHFHGAVPFLVTSCADYDRVIGGVEYVAHQPVYWEWLVDPLTREVTPAQSDLDEIREVLEDADEIALHNAKFDAHSLAAVGVELPLDKVRDTLFTSHLLASNHPHNLTDTILEYLGADIQPFEDRTEAAVKACRQSIKRNEWLGLGIDCSGWRLAESGAEDMPSVNGSSKRDEDKPWKNDMWLPATLAEAVLCSGADLEEAGFQHGWADSVREYANADSAGTLALWLWMREEVNRRGQRKILDDKFQLVQVALDLELHGVTISRTETRRLVDEYRTYVDAAQAECVAIAESYDFDLELPSGSSPNDSLREFFWGSTRLRCPECGTERKHKIWSDGELQEIVCRKCLKRKKNPRAVECVVDQNPCMSLPRVYNNATGLPTIDKNAMEHYVTTLEPGRPLDFVQCLTGMRSRQTAIAYMEGYERFWLPLDGADDDWRVMHPSANPTGTDTLRWSFSNPNSSNISKKEDFNLRRCFGPAPGREWWSMDFKNIERRLPVYKCGEPKMVEVFDKPDDPPYFGNLYCLTASALYPDKYWPLSREKDQFKKVEPGLYKRAKFFDLAKQYGCGAKKGDLLSGVRNSSALMATEFPMFAAYQAETIAFANRYGYVETFPDKSVDPDRGYPILVSRRDDGRVVETTPFAYMISGTAMWVTNRAMVKTERQVREWRAAGWSGFLTLQVHDELVWDCPRGEGPEPWLANLPKMDVLRSLMESCGDDIGVPTPVSREWHGETYAVGKSV